MKYNTPEKITDLLIDECFLALAAKQYGKDRYDLEPFLLHWPDRKDDIMLALQFVNNVRIEESPFPLLVTPGYIHNSCNRMMETAGKARRKKLRIRRYFYSGVAASVMLIIGLSVSFIGFHNEAEYVPVFADMIPQNESVRIIVDESETIALTDKDDKDIVVGTDGSVTVGSQQVIEAKTNKEITTSQILVPFGKRTKIMLPDGSSLWINSGSKVAYQSDFTSNRKLFVEGEVFIDVKKDKKHPFIVKTGNLEVEVLGTAFNISDFKQDNASSVVLVRGSVAVKAGEQKTTLSPKQKLDLDRSSGKTAVESDVNVYQYTCWTDDIINFRDESLEHIFKALASYYNIRISLNADLKDVLCSGSLDLNDSIEELMETIGTITPITYIIEDDQIIIDKTQ